VNEHDVNVNIKGELPLFKTHDMEKAGKAWFMRQLKSRENELKLVL
jgi:hypothetical protein